MTAATRRTGRQPALAAAIALALAAGCLRAAAGDAAPAPKGGFVVAPVVYYTPETRIAWGFVGIHYFRFGAARRADRLSHYRFNVIRTQNQQSIAQVDYELYLPGGGLLLDGMAKYSYYPDRFYGIGNRSAEEDREDYVSSNWRFRVDLQRRWGGNFYAGLRLESHSLQMRETEAGGMLETGAVSGSAGGSLAGSGLLAKWDSRDNTFSSSRGVYAALAVNRYFRLLGGDHAFGELALDARGYWPLGRNVMALQGIVRSVWGDCPFQALPRFGGLNLLRGYFDGRYRDRAMLALQGEFRLPLGRRVGLCAFAGAAQVQKKLALLELDGFHAAGGAGIRYKFNLRENLVVRLDVGFAGPKPAFYLTFAEAF